MVSVTGCAEISSYGINLLLLRTLLLFDLLVVCVVLLFSVSELEISPNYPVLLERVNQFLFSVLIMTSVSVYSPCIFIA
jgi:hypothetical protein